MLGFQFFTFFVWHRSQSREVGCSRSSRNHSEDDVRSSEPWRCHRVIDRKHSEDVSDEQRGDLSNSREKSRRRTRQRDKSDHSDTSPDDLCDSNLTVDWERRREESEFEHKKSKRRKIKDGLVRRKGENSSKYYSRHPKKSEREKSHEVSDRWEPNISD